MTETQKKKTRWTIPVRSKHTFRKRSVFSIPQENVIDLKGIKGQSKSEQSSRHTPSTLLPQRQWNVAESMQRKLKSIFNAFGKRGSVQEAQQIARRPQNNEVAPKYQRQTTQFKNTQTHIVPPRTRNKALLFSTLNDRHLPLKQEQREYQDAIQKIRPKFTLQGFQRVFKHIIIFGGVAFVLISPVYILRAYGKIQQQKVLFEEAMQQGTDTIQLGVDLLLRGEVKSAEDMFRKAEAQFQNAQGRLYALTGGVELLKWLPSVGTKLRAAEHLAIAGREASIAGTKIAFAIAGFERLESIGNFLGLSDVQVPLTTAIAVVQKSLTPSEQSHLVKARTFLDLENCQLHRTKLLFHE